LYALTAWPTYQTFNLRKKRGGWKLANVILFFSIIVLYYYTTRVSVIDKLHVMIVVIILKKMSWYSTNKKTIFIMTPKYVWVKTIQPNLSFQLRKKKLVQETIKHAFGHDSVYVHGIYNAYLTSPVTMTDGFLHDTY